MSWCLLFLPLVMLGSHDGSRSASCSCKPVRAVAEAVEGAEAVFFARVLRIYAADYRNPDGDRVAELEVIARWKGALPDTVRLAAGDGRGECKYVFVEGREYLVYGRALLPGAPADWYASMCSRTRPAEQAAGDLIELSVLLGAPQRPRGGHPSRSSP